MPSEVIRWRFEDPSDPNPDTRSYEFPINPNTMGSPFPTRNITVQGTTAVDGQLLMWEGMRSPADFTFGGTVLAGTQYEALRSWVYGKNGRLFLFDHYGRRMVVILKAFKPEPKRMTGRFYWRHDYSIDCIVVSITQPTVEDA